MRKMAALGGLSAPDHKPFHSVCEQVKRHTYTLDLTEAVTCTDTVKDIDQSYREITEAEYLRPEKGF